MWEKQNEAENERMALQHQWNEEAAAKSQEYAKEMFDYTGYENQVKQMKAAGLNAALLNGGSGSGGQASAGAKVQPATAFQPMGVQAALEAQQTMAQTNLTNAQAQSVKAQTVRQITENLIGTSIDLINKITENFNIKKETQQKQAEIEKTKAVINNLTKTGQQIDANIDLIKKEGLKKEEETELIKFQNAINNTLKNATEYYTDEKGKIS